MELVTTLITFLIVIIVYWYLRYNEFNKHLKKFRGPPPLPIFGHALYMRSTKDVLRNAYLLHKFYGSLCKGVIGFGNPMISISDPTYLEYILGSTKLIEKSVDYKYLERWLGTGLLTSGGAKWKKHRKILTPAFHFQILQQFSEVYDQYAGILVDKLKSEVGDSSVDIYPYVTLCSLDIICATSMGTAVHAQDNSESDYIRSVKQVCRIAIKRSTDVIKMFDTLYAFTEDYQLEKRAVKILHNYTYSVIKTRNKELQDSESNQLNHEDTRSNRKSLLDLMIDYKQKYGSITDENIREEVDTFMFEGHDTVASAISFTLYNLARHSNVQSKVLEELCEIFENDFERPATYHDLQAMKYLDKVLKEALRLYPSVPLYGRRVIEDVEFDGGILPKGLTIIINAYSMHRDPKIYPNPREFDPERFSFENQSQRSPYAYVPFSAGSRNSLGQKFAMLEMKGVLSKFLRAYEVLPSVPEHKLTLVAEGTLKSSNGVCIQLKKRIIK